VPRRQRVRVDDDPFELRLLRSVEIERFQHRELGDRRGVRQRAHLARHREYVDVLALRDHRPLLNERAIPPEPLVQRFVPVRHDHSVPEEAVRRERVVERDPKDEHRLQPQRLCHAHLGDDGAFLVLVPEVRRVPVALLRVDGHLDGVEALCRQRRPPHEVVGLVHLNAAHPPWLRCLLFGTTTPGGHQSEREQAGDPIHRLDPYSTVHRLANMVIRGVLFDKDGTLFDFFTVWVPACREAATHVVTDMGRPELLDAILSAGGLEPATGRVTPGSLLAAGTTDELIAAWARVADDGWRAAYADDVHRIFHRHASAAPKEVAPLAALFDDLRGRGLKIGVATQDSTAAAEAALVSAGARALVDVVLGADAVARPKPAPDMVEAFARAAGVDASEVMMVGDSTVDLEMGRAAGVGRVVGVLSGPSEHADLEPLADDVIASVAVLPSVLTSGAE
jgi:phosphoglycolate phosphatase